MQMQQRQRENAPQAQLVSTRWTARQLQWTEQQTRTDATRAVPATASMTAVQQQQQQENVQKSVQESVQVKQVRGTSLVHGRATRGVRRGQMQARALETTGQMQAGASGTRVPDGVTVARVLHEGMMVQR